MPCSPWLAGQFDFGRHLDQAHAVLGLDRDLVGGMHGLVVLAPAQRQHDGGDDGHQQDHRGDLEGIGIVGEQHPGQLLGVAVVGRQVLRRQVGQAEVLAGKHHSHFRREQAADDDTQRQVGPEAGATRSMLMSSIITTKRNSTITAPT
jgi:hypothetical protein